MTVTRTCSLRRAFLLVGLLLLVLSGCLAEQGEQTDACAPFDDPLRTVSFDDLHGPAGFDWIKATYDVTDEEIGYSPYPGGEQATIWMWDSDDLRQSYAIYYSGNRAIFVYLTWERSRPTLQMLIDCVGDPEYYALYFYQDLHNRQQFEIELWYPQQGRLVQHSEVIYGAETPTVIIDVPMQLMTITRPGDLESVVRAAYTPRDEEVMEDVLRTVQPWPDDLTDLQITTDVKR